MVTLAADTNHNANGHSENPKRIGVREADGKRSTFHTLGSALKTQTEADDDDDDDGDGDVQENKTYFLILDTPNESSLRFIASGRNVNGG
ncbi:signal transduction histidine kinase-like protein [Anopheles sinensis]|uniref:Signal transduction histidine kinase-like protein n=1 Tax=Anopheles sinensis TaxID=74873 RepID=A0A084VV11_ANOSI|nr:signal transduction histidine kinase-like protein [Anopheles sinensis]